LLLGFDALSDDAMQVEGGEQVDDGFDHGSWLRAYVIRPEPLNDRS
jgi:hypothetical protein